ncbi:RNA polymerase subunit sigma-70 [Rhizobacter sp. Root1221]|nr:RNA polymerase subunit sigma-70 [Rhizobacter sp. Root1221]
MPPLPLIPRRFRGGASDDGTEMDLLRRIAAGDRAALEALYRSYHRRLDRFLGRVTRRADMIEEVINDTFWIVWQKADQFRGDSRVSTWIVGIAYRCVLKTLRQHGGDPLELTEQVEALPSLIDPNAVHELRDWVAKALDHLPVEQRVALELAYGAGHSLEEIAGIMQCEVSTVKARMHHARVQLRNLLPVLAGPGRAHAEGSEDESIAAAVQP